MDTNINKYLKYKYKYLKLQIGGYTQNTSDDDFNLKMLITAIDNYFYAQSNHSNSIHPDLLNGLLCNIYYPLLYLSLNYTDVFPIRDVIDNITNLPDNYIYKIKILSLLPKLNIDNYIQREFTNTFVNIIEIYYKYIYFDADVYYDYRKRLINYYNEFITQHYNNIPNIPDLFECSDIDANVQLFDIETKNYNSNNSDFLNTIKNWIRVSNDIEQLNVSIIDSNDIKKLNVSISNHDNIYIQNQPTKPSRRQKIKKWFIEKKNKLIKILKGGAPDEKSEDGYFVENQIVIYKLLDESLYKFNLYKETWSDTIINGLLCLINSCLLYLQIHTSNNLMMTKYIYQQYRNVIDTIIGMKQDPIKNTLLNDTINILRELQKSINPDDVISEVSWLTSESHISTKKNMRYTPSYIISKYIQCITILTLVDNEDIKTSIDKYLKEFNIKADPNAFSISVDDYKKKIKIVRTTIEIWLKEVNNSEVDANLLDTECAQLYLKTIEHFNKINEFISNNISGLVVSVQTISQLIDADNNNIMEYNAFIEKHHSFLKKDNNKNLLWEKTEILIDMLELKNKIYELRLKLNDIQYESIQANYEITNLINMYKLDINEDLYKKYINVIKDNKLNLLLNNYQEK